MKTESGPGVDLPTVLAFDIIRTNKVGNYASLQYDHIIDLSSYKVNKTRFSLFGVVLYKDSPRHFAVIVKRNGEWLWIDDLFGYKVSKETPLMAGAPLKYTDLWEISRGQKWIASFLFYEYIE